LHIAARDSMECCTLVSSRTRCSRFSRTSLRFLFSSPDGEPFLVRCRTSQRKWTPRWRCGAAATIASRAVGTYQGTASRQSHYAGRCRPVPRRRPRYASIKGRNTRCATRRGLPASHCAAVAGAISMVASWRVPVSSAISSHNSPANSSRPAKKKSNLSSSRSASAASHAVRVFPLGVCASSTNASSAIARTNRTCTALLRYTAATRCCCSPMPHTVLGPPD